MDAKTVIAILGIPVAAIAAVTAIDVRAQSSGEKAAKTEVQVQMAPVQMELAKIVEGQRRDEDWKKNVRCLDKQHQDLTPEDREIKCQEESDERWEAWDEEDKPNPGDPE